MRWASMDNCEKRHYRCASDACVNQAEWWGSAGSGEDEVTSTWCSDCRKKIDAAAPRVVSASDLLSATDRGDAPSAFDKTGGGRCA